MDGVVVMVERVALQELLRACAMDEVIEGYECERCCAGGGGSGAGEGATRFGATRTVRFTKHPPVLLCNLQRARFDRVKMQPYKTAIPVDFPNAFQASLLPLSDTSAAAASSSQAGGAAADASTRWYRLSAVIVHDGSVNPRSGRLSSQNGHYYALCRAGEDWFEANDSLIRKRSEEQVLAHRSNCFVLAYELVGE